MFFSISLLRSKVFYVMQTVMVRQLPLKLLFRDFLRMICYIDFKYGSINFHKLETQPAKQQHLEIAPLITV